MPARSRLAPSFLVPVATATVLACVAAAGMFLVDAPLPTVAALLVALAYAGFAAVSVVLALVDLATHRLPNRIVLPSGAAFAALLALAVPCGADPRALLRALLGAAALFAFHLVLRLISPAGMGGGDVKLAAVAGLALGWLGWGVLVGGLVAAYLLGGGVALVLIAIGRADRRTRLPFGPFLLLGAWTAIVVADAAGRGYGL